jgi:hypothetical protein
LFFSDKPARKIFVFFSCWGLSSAVKTFSKWVALQFFGDELASAASILIVALFYFSFLPVYWRHLRPLVDRGLSLLALGRSVYAFFPVLAFLVFSGIFGWWVTSASWQWLLMLLLFELMILFMYYILFSHLAVVHDKVYMEEALKQAALQQDYQLLQYRQLDVHLTEQQRLVHDTRHHLLSLHRLIQEGNTFELSQYLEDVMNHFEPGAVMKLCDNPLVNAILSRFREDAGREGIAFEVQADIPDSCGIDRFDLSVFFGNALENALEACRRIDRSSPLYTKRYIYVNARFEDSCLVVLISNSCPDMGMVRGINFPSVKGDRRGIGLKSIEQIALACNGAVNCSAEHTRFVLSAVLCSEGHQHQSLRQNPVDS